MDLGSFGPEFGAFLTVVAIDLTLAGDNALIIGLAVAGLPQDLRKRAVLLGIAAAAGLRIVFAIFTVHLLEIVGLALAGGILLLWVAWKLWREIRQMPQAGDQGETGGPPKSLRQAITQIFIADVSMSLDNVLAVAGAARDHYMIMVLGLALSVILTGFGANLVAKLIHRHRWISYVGLAIILYVALTMIWDSGHALMRG